MKRVIILFFLATSLGCLQAQIEHFQGSFEIENGKIIVQYPKKGEILRMRFSSVLPGNYLSRETADRLKYEYSMGSDSFYVFQYFLPACFLKQGSDTYFVISDFSKAEELEGLDGVMGRGLLQFNVVNMDFKNRKISFTETIEEDLSERKIDTLPMYVKTDPNTLYYASGVMEYDHKKDSVDIVFNFIEDYAMLASLKESFRSKDADSSITILSPSPFQAKIHGSQIKYVRSYDDAERSTLYLGLPFLEKYKNAIFDYPHNRVLLVE